MSRIMSVQHLKQAVAFVASFSMSLPVVGDGQALVGKSSSSSGDGAQQQDFGSCALHSLLGADRRGCWTFIHFIL